jgi:energy-coupling factor transporter ATP-binding protein EcfA2
MKLIAFQSSSYRNLLPRPVRFVQTSESILAEGMDCTIRFLVGRNGSGKTNLLRFLSSIFIALDEDYRHPHPDSPAYHIPFRLKYELHKEIIEIQSNGEGRSGLIFTISDQPREPGDIPSSDSILPATLLVYTTGDENDWRTLFRPSPIVDDQEETELNWDERRPEDELPPRKEYQQSKELLTQPEETTEFEETSVQEPARIFLVQPADLKLALLAALVDHHYRQPAECALDDALAEVPVHLLAFSFHVSMKNPTEQTEKPLTPSQRRFLSRMYDLATLPLKYWEEQQWVYDLTLIDATSGKTTLERLVENPLNDPFQFFQVLSTLQDIGIIHSVNLVVEYNPPKIGADARCVLLSDYLSDGEFAFLSRMALIYLLNEKECLFLLDEPEVHFNDDWKRNLVDSIERALAGTQSEVILTSHSSIVLTDAYPDEIILLTYNGQGDTIPLTFAAEQGEVLRMLFESERSVGRRAIRHVKKVLDEESPEKLRNMLDQVGPGYYRFKIVRELQRLVPPDQPNQLSSTEQTE